VIAVSYVQPPPGHASFHGRTTSAGDRSFNAAGLRVEQFMAAPATRHELCAFQASTKNISIWVNHGTLCLFAVLRLRNTLTYLQGHHSSF